MALRKTVRAVFGGLLALSILLAGCYRLGNLFNPPAPAPGTDQAKEESKNQPPAVPSMADASALVEAFVRARLAGDESGAKAMMTPDAAAKLAGQPVPKTAGEPRLNDFALADRGPTVSGRAVGVIFSETGTKEPLARLTEETVTAGFVAGALKIVDLAADPSRKAVASQKAGIISTQGPGQVPPRTLRLAELPPDFVPQGGGPENRFGVAKDAFGPMAYSPDFAQLAVTTRGTHTFLAVYRPAEGSLTGVDLYYGGGVSLAPHWSPDSRYLAVPVDSAAGTSRTDIYDINTVKKLNFNLFTHFPPETYNFIPAGWNPSGGRLALDVSREDQKTDDKTGRWILSVPSGDLNRIK